MSRTSGQIAATYLKGHAGRLVRPARALTR
jgi:hypothetical protein